MSAVLKPHDFFLSGSQIVIQQSDSGGRTDFISQRSPRNGHGAMNPPTVKNRVIVPQSRYIFRTPTAQPSRSLSAEIATPWNVCNDLADRRVQRSGPERLHAPLTAAGCRQILSVPLRKSPDELKSPHHAQRHAVEICLLRIGILERIKAVTPAVGICFVEKTAVI